MAGKRWAATYRFANAMRRKLEENRHKGGWGDDSPESLLQRLREEVDELRDAIADPEATAEQVRNEAADVGNFAMMLFDNADADKRPGLARVPYEPLKAAAAFALSVLRAHPIEMSEKMAIEKLAAALGEQAQPKRTKT